MNRITVKDMRRAVGGLEKLQLIVEKAMRDVVRGSIDNPETLKRILPEYAEQFDEVNRIIGEYMDIAREFCVQNNLKIQFPETEKEVSASGVVDELVATARRNYRELEWFVEQAMKQIRE
jgi:hypothetical protein